MRIGRKEKLKNNFKFLWFLFLSALLYVPENCLAQDLFNSGRINNSGAFRVKDRVDGLRDSINGIFDYFGSNQTIQAIQYNDLMLTGSGIKSTVGGDFLAKSNITIRQDVVLQIETGSILKLGGRLFEEGYLIGSIQKEVELDGTTPSSDFGNIGATIIWSGIASGRIVTTRTSGTPQIANGHESVLRYYDINPTINGNLSANIILKYSDNELNGHDPTKLLLWRSVDSGKTWKIQRGINDTSTRSIAKQGLSSFGRFTFTDSLHPIGSLRQSVGMLAIYSGNNQTQPINTILQPFIVAIKDSDGVPLAGEYINFSITESPISATGQVLSDTIIQTNLNGLASTTLRLGDKVGRYSVTVSLMDNPDNLVVFTATAYAGAAAIIERTVGNNQIQDIGTTLSNPFIVTVLDTSGNAVPNANVSFNIAEIPEYAQGQQ
ncbi:MAG: hypothetical protein HY800_06865, partial [Ignavibacteriales bacterium]|nr:hypothetical protein [Ignavibacteriales bacterium]